MRTILQDDLKGKNFNVTFVDTFDDQVRHRAKLVRRIARRHDLQLNFASLIVDVANLGGERR